LWPDEPLSFSLFFQMTYKTGRLSYKNRIKALPPRHATSLSLLVRIPPFRQHVCGARQALWRHGASLMPCLSEAATRNIRHPSSSPTRRHTLLTDSADVDDSLSPTESRLAKEAHD
jgi:hypothetical protein